jgi:hypothetical protein
MRGLLVTLLIALLTGTAAFAGGHPHGCTNKAGRVQGSCKHAARTPPHATSKPRPNYTTISGTVIAINGELAQFREDDGTTVTIDQSNLLANGQPLTAGGHFALHGYFSNNIFYAQANGGNGAGNGANGYPYPASTTSVQGIITSVNGSRVTIMQGLFSTLTIDDQQALKNGTAQNLIVGRSVTAYGYWSGSVFYATSVG